MFRKLRQALRIVVSKTNIKFAGAEQASFFTLASFAKARSARALPRYAQDARCMQNAVTKRGTRSGAKPILTLRVQNKLHFFCS